MKEASGSAAVLGECLMTLLASRDPDDFAAHVDAAAAARRIGEFVNLVCGALAKKK